MVTRHIAELKSLGTTKIVQIGIVVSDIVEKAQIWVDIFRLPVQDIMVTDRVEIAHTEYAGKAWPARAKLAFFRDMGGPDVEHIEPIDGPST